MMKYNELLAKVGVLVEMRAAAAEVVSNRIGG